MTATTATVHAPWCTDHITVDGLSYCHRQTRVEGASGAFVLDLEHDDEGRLIIDAYIESGSTFTADEARRIASALREQASIIDAAALPAGQGSAVTVSHVAMLAGCPTFDVRHAMASGELTAHKAVDGSRRLLVESNEGVAWAKAQRTA